MVWAGDQLIWEIRQASQSPGEESSTAGSYGTVSYTHAGGIDRPLVITKGSTSILPHQNWRGQFSSGTYTSGARSDCPVGVTTGCHPVAWPGWRTTATHAASEDHDIRTWWGGLVDGMRDASGQMYMRNRYYDPATGQFTQPDPIGLAGGLNSYGFAAGDPVSYSDPYGLSVSCNPPTPECIVQARLRAAWAAVGEKASAARKGLLSLASNLPIIGESNDVGTALTGHDALNGEDVGTGGRILAGLGAISPIGSGGQFRAVADAIGRGHAFTKHVLNYGEFKGLDIRTTAQFSNLIEGIMQGARGADVKRLNNGRTGYWDSSTGTVVIHDPRSRDQGTAFRPTRGRAYFDNLK